jgi:hypothetical protein
MQPTTGIPKRTDMAHAIALDSPELEPPETPVPTPRPPDVFGTQPAALAERSAQSTKLGSATDPMDEAQDPLLSQMRYDAYLAGLALQELFESGQLGFLSV